MALSDEQKARMSEGRKRAAMEKQASREAELQGKTPEEQELIKIRWRKEEIAKQMAVLKSKERAAQAIKTKKTDGAMMALGQLLMFTYRKSFAGGGDDLKKAIKAGLACLDDKSKFGRDIKAQITELLHKLDADMAVPLPCLSDMCVPLADWVAKRADAEFCETWGVDVVQGDDGKHYLRVPAGADLRCLDCLPVDVSGLDYIKYAGLGNRHGF